MEIAREGKILIYWNGRNVTGDISKYISAVSYTDHEEGSCDECSITLLNEDGLWSGSWYPDFGDTVRIYLGYTDSLMDCGLFEIDELKFSGVPDMLEIKGIAAGITKELRTRNNKEFESQTLKQIAEYFCTKHSLELVDDTVIDSTQASIGQVVIDRKTQEDKSDLQFLAEIATEYGFVFSIRGTKMVFVSYYTLDNKESSFTLRKNQLSNYSISEKTWDTYQAANVKSLDVKNDAVIEDSQNSEVETTKVDTIEIKSGSRNTQQAEIVAKAALWDKNKLKQTGALNDLPGNAGYVAGLNFDLVSMQNMGGKWHITTSNHNVSGDGAYTTSLEIRKTGFIPIPEVATVETTDSQYDEGNSYKE